MKDKKKNNRLWSGEFKLKVVLDIIENELSYSQAASKYDMYLSSGSLNALSPHFRYKAQQYFKVDRLRPYSRSISEIGTPS